MINELKLLENSLLFVMVVYIRAYIHGSYVQNNIFKTLCKITVISPNFLV